MTHKAEDYEQLLHDEVGTYYADPTGFVLSMYDWPINGEEGPDTWQSTVLTEIGEEVKARGFTGIGNVLPIREAISSGHSIGKSALIAWVVDWLMSTRPECRGTVSANTNEQLEKKTWAAVREWTAKCRTGHWFEINSKIMFRVGNNPKTGKPWRSTWFCSPQSCAEENSESFAGQHARGSTSFYLFDEASAIPDMIWEVAEGGLTDEPLIMAVGNPTRNTGKFYEAAFGRQRNRWKTHVIDAEQCKLANHRLIEEWIQDYGEDSDFVRVRVRGLPPNASELQFIDNLRVWQAQKNQDLGRGKEPLIAGVDVSGGGAAWTVCRFRRGLDARSIPPIRITGENTVKDDRQLVIAKLADALSWKGKNKVDAMFIDSAFGAVIVYELRNRGFRNVFEVNFGAPAPDDHYANMRSFMYGQAKEWLPRGCIAKDDVRLETDLCAPGYHLNKKNQIVLEPKEKMLKRGCAPPDDGDGHALTFAQPVQVAYDASDLEEFTPPQMYG